jgi:hypothetical protein
MMWNKAFAWLGFGDQKHDAPRGHGDHRHGHRNHASAHGHDHTHGVVDSVLVTTARGIWAIKWSFVILGVTAALQLGIVVLG